MPPQELHSHLAPHQLSVVVAGTGNFAFRSLLHGLLFATAFHRPRRAVLIRSKDPGKYRQSAKVKSMITMVIFTPAIFMRASVVSE